MGGTSGKGTKMAISEDRYQDLTDRRLAAALLREDAAEERGDLHADDRRTCWTHRGWATDCATALMHRNPCVLIAGEVLAGATWR
jgi:hypothetical protein